MLTDFQLNIRIRIREAYPFIFVRFFHSFASASRIRNTDTNPFGIMIGFDEKDHKFSLGIRIIKST